MFNPDRISELRQVCENYQWYDAEDSMRFGGPWPRCDIKQLLAKTGRALETFPALPSYAWEVSSEKADVQVAYCSCAEIIFPASGEPPIDVSVASNCNAAGGGGGGDADCQAGEDMSPGECEAIPGCFAVKVKCAPWAEGIDGLDCRSCESRRCV